jgi:hypothetical protein
MIVSQNRGNLAMNSLTQALALPHLAARPRRRRFAVDAWMNLFFGSGPIWWRMMRWAQRNNVN